MTQPLTVLDAHIAYMQARSLSRTHIADRRRAITRLATVLDKDPITATYDDLLAYLPTINRSTPRSRYAEISHLVQWYRWLVVHGHRADDPSVRLPKPKLPRLLPRPMSEANVEAAISNAEPRVRLILVLAAFAGLRACEIARLHRTDILDGLEIPSLVAHGKGSKDRVVPMCDRVILELRRYGIPARGPLFPRLDGKPGAWTPGRVSMVANLYLHDQGIADTLHCLRHRAATGWQRKTGDLLVVATLLGHETPATAMVYAQYDNKAGYAAVQALGGNAPPVKVAG
jgi:site-specific recombinase XerD